MCCSIYHHAESRIYRWFVLFAPKEGPRDSAMLMEMLIVYDGVHRKLRIEVHRWILPGRTGLVHMLAYRVSLALGIARPRNWGIWRRQSARGVSETKKKRKFYSILHVTGYSSFNLILNITYYADIQTTTRKCLIYCCAAGIHIIRIPHVLGYLNSFSIRA